MRLFGVITTIRSPTDSTVSLGARLASRGGRLIVAGDAKGPEAYEVPSSMFLSLSRQLELPLQLPRLLPCGHYARKNVGYLEAMHLRAECIYETDDDNCPAASWGVRSEFPDELRCVADVDAVAGGVQQWVNAYGYFSTEFIWPRGLPLTAVRAPVPGTHPAVGLRAPIQQGLVDGSPDVDAIWRLLMDRPFTFEQGSSVRLGPGNWCPFNSQSTWWWPVAYPLMYIPSHCTFRMCDIWRSLVAQRCLWALGYGVVFHAPEVVQDRNPHDLMRDFHDEIPGYERNAELAARLMAVSLASGAENVGTNLRKCYDALVEGGFFPPLEMELVSAWLADLARLQAEA